MIFSKKYQPLWTGEYRYAILTGGRGSGKSFAKQTFLRDLTYEAGHKIAATRYTMISAEKSVIPEFSSKIEAENLSDHFTLNGRTYTNETSGSELFFMGLKTSAGIQTASLKSIEGLTTWAMEEAEELIDDGTEVEACTFDRIDDTLRKVDSRLRTICAWNPSDEDSFLWKRFFEKPGVPYNYNGTVNDTLYIYTSYLDNRQNLNESFMRKAEQVRESNPDRYDHIYLGKPRKSNPFALWKRDTMISPFRVEAPPELRRIVVAVDPSIAAKGDHDECGIIVAGEGYDKDFYVLEDGSAQMSPRDWGRKVGGLFRDYRADLIIAETNQGGQMVVDTIRNTGQDLPVKTVNATRGKLLRAEPISALYEEGRVHHVGHFPELESEMISFTGKPGEKSPNRLDGLVYAITELSDLTDEGSFSFI